MENPTTSVYRYYDKSGILIYVGITSASGSRNRQHNADKAWWPFVVSQEVDHRSNREQAHAHEVALISRYRPPFNVQHNPDHQQIKAAYLACQTLGVFDGDPRELFQRRRGVFPVDVYRVDSREGSAELRTRMDDAALALKLEHRSEACIRLSEGGRRIGVIGSIIMAGPIARLMIPAMKKGVSFDSASARIRPVSRKGPIVYEVKYIAVSDSTQPLRESRSVREKNVRAAGTHR